MAATVNLPVTEKMSPPVDKVAVNNSASASPGNGDFSRTLHQQMNKQQSTGGAEHSAGADPASNQKNVQKQSDDSTASSPAESQQSQAATSDKPVTSGEKLAGTDKTTAADQAQTDKVDTAIAAAMQGPGIPMDQLRELIANSLRGTDGGQPDGKELPLAAVNGTSPFAKGQANLLQMLNLRAENLGAKLAQMDGSNSNNPNAQAAVPPGLLLLQQQLEQRLAALQQEANPSAGADSPDSGNGLETLTAPQLKGLDKALQSLAAALNKGDTQGIATAREQLLSQIQSLPTQQGKTAGDTSNFTDMLKTLAQDMTTQQQTLSHGDDSAKVIRLAFQEMMGKLGAQVQHKPEALGESASTATTTANASTSPLTGTLTQASPSQNAPQTSQTTTVNVPVNQQAWGQAIGERLQWMVKQNLEQAQIKLNPRHLGPIDVKISMNQDQATVTFSAHHVMTRDALEGAIPRLREMMGDNGINLVDVNVSHHSGDQGQQANADQGQSGSSHPSWSAQNTMVDDLGSVADSRGSPWIMGSNRMLDTYV